MAGELSSRMTIDDFLEWDARQALRSELVDGVVYAMAGAEDRHVTLALNLAMALRQHTTAAYDRGEKFAHYRKLPSLQEYGLVDPDSRRTDVYRKGSDGLWVLHPFAPGDAVHLTGVDLVISAESLFAEVE